MRCGQQAGSTRLSDPAQAYLPKSQEAGNVGLRQRHLHVDLGHLSQRRQLHYYNRRHGQSLVVGDKADVEPRDEPALVAAVPTSGWFPASSSPIQCRHHRCYGGAVLLPELLAQRGLLGSPPCGSGAAWLRKGADLLHPPLPQLCVLLLRRRRSLRPALPRAARATCPAARRAVHHAVARAGRGGDAERGGAEADISRPAAATR